MYSSSSSLREGCSYTGNFRETSLITIYCTPQSAGQSEELSKLKVQSHPRKIKPGPTLGTLISLECTLGSDAHKSSIFLGTWTSTGLPRGLKEGLRIRGRSGAGWGGEAETTTGMWGLPRCGSPLGTAQKLFQEPLGTLGGGLWLLRVPSAPPLLSPTSSEPHSGACPSHLRLTVVHSARSSGSGEAAAAAGARAGAGAEVARAAWKAAVART